MFLFILWHFRLLYTVFWGWYFSFTARFSWAKPPWKHNNNDDIYTPKTHTKKKLSSPKIIYLKYLWKILSGTYRKHTFYLHPSKVMLAQFSSHIEMDKKLSLSSQIILEVLSNILRSNVYHKFIWILWCICNNNELYICNTELKLILFKLKFAVTLFIITPYGSCGL